MKAIISLLLSPFTTILHGLALKVLWGWFIVTTFSLPFLNIPQALGLGLIVQYLTHQENVEDNRDSDERWITGIVIAIAKPLMFLFIGWIIHLFL